MPITFTVDHARRLVLVIATGIVTRETVVDYFDTQRRLKGLSYPRLVECRHIESRLSSDDWRVVTQWLRKVTGEIALGPAAVVVDDERTCELVKAIAILVADICELQPFDDRESAEEWLSEHVRRSLMNRR